MNQDKAIKIIKDIQSTRIPPIKLVGLYGDRKNWYRLKKLFINEAEDETIREWREIIKAYKKTQKTRNTNS